MQPDPAAILIAEDGRVFSGRRFGAAGEAFGPGVVFTGMTGYQEMLTDPDRAHQIVVATTAHVGNTGWNDQDSRSDRIQVAGYAIRDPSPRPSSWRSRRGLSDEMAAQQIVGICGVDTRALTIHLREHPRIRLAISSVDLDPESLLAKLRRAGHA